MKHYLTLADDLDTLAGHMLVNLTQLPRHKRVMVRLLAKVLLNTSSELRKHLAE